jgi:hypothetical protein
MTLLVVVRPIECAPLIELLVVSVEKIRYLDFSLQDLAYMTSFH